MKLSNKNLDICSTTTNYLKVKIYPAFWTALLYVIVTMALGIVYFGLLSVLYQFFIDKNAPIILVNILDGFGRLFYALPIVFLLYKKSGVNIREQIKVPKISEVIVMTILVVAIYGFFFLLRFFFADKMFEYNNSLYIKNEWFNLISILVLAPIIEEVFYRGLILHQFLKRYNKLTAILLSSLLFTLSHLNLMTAISTFVFSVLLSFLYCKLKKSLIIAILFHLIWNILYLVV